ncbi:MAG: M15 family metallopeptidase [Vallitaleaceae bacterium]|jgi:hypothetical protein|nr:M15 family metallopeptidase [Vallitaleaceae bacterium]
MKKMNTKIIVIIGFALLCIMTVTLLYNKGLRDKASDNRANQVAIDDEIIDAIDNQSIEGSKDNMPLEANDTDDAQAIEQDTSLQGFIVPIFTFEPLPEITINQMSGITWSEDAPVSLEELRLVHVTYVGFDGLSHYGTMVVNESVAVDVVEIFREIYEAGFSIEKIELIDIYGGDDDLSMADNNSSAFNYREVPGTTSISKHSYGVAIDINPIQNPYIVGDEVMPEVGRDYLDRDDVRQGMIVTDDVVYDAFISRGWTWGGEWRSVKDYQHFVKED